MMFSDCACPKYQVQSVKYKVARGPAGHPAWLGRCPAGNRPIDDELPPGTVISYRYGGLVHADGLPRFPSISKVHDAACECRACVKGDAWPVSPFWRVAGNGQELERVPGAPADDNGKLCMDVQG